MTHAIASDRPPAGFEPLADYCALCTTHRGCERCEVIYLPEAIEFGTGPICRAFYRCDCGHAWTCHWRSDLLDGEETL
ncbi:hypothetical protein ACWDUL_23165 [Nocardia niigatensis]